MSNTGRPERSDYWLWREAIAFARAAGHCSRSDEWHSEAPCITCQEIVNFARRVLTAAAGEPVELDNDGQVQGAFRTDKDARLFHSATSPAPERAALVRELHIAFNVAVHRAGGRPQLPACDGLDCAICEHVREAATLLKAEQS